MIVSNSEVSEGRNLSEQAYDGIRKDILYGGLFPRRKLQIDEMSDLYSIGVVPVREALNRLSSEGLVARKGNRGFFVTEISIAELEELVKTRIWLEKKALSESIKNATDAWEEALVIDYHRLARTQRRLTPDVGHQISEEWEKVHKRFHMRLLEGCGSKLLLEFCSGMMDQAVRYRSISLNNNQNKQRREGAKLEHESILRATIARDADTATRLLQEHYQTTLNGLKEVLLVPQD
jgi:GntR family transcriptional regulator, carbon starvation induced regulator